MKKKIILFVILFINTGIYCQTIFDRYSNNDDVTLISISPKIFKMLGKMSINLDYPEAQDYLDMVSSITNFKVLTSSNQKICSEILTWFKKQTNKEGFKLLINVKDLESNVTFYVKDSQVEDHVEHLLMHVTESKETILLLLEGNINLNKISNLLDLMNLPGGNKLKKMK